MIFTDDELKNLHILTKELNEELANDITEEDKERLASYIKLMEERGAIERNVFGLNELLCAMQTSLIAVRSIGLKRESVFATVLYAGYENGILEIKQIETDFGQNVAQIIQGLARIQNLYKKNPIIESENFRNLLLSFAKDMRVILIMIADRVNLMRQIRDTTNKEAQKQVAEEASYLYAPLAHKLGLYQLKSELEDLSLKYLEHDAYYHIKEKLNETKKERDAYIKQFIEPVSKALQNAGLRFHIKGRTKSIHSIWQKMKKQKCAFEGIYDLFAIRIILDSPLQMEKMQCWQAYSIVTDMYQPNPKRLRDWLSVPKSNGYECLHITVLGPNAKWVEVQIRTERMDEIAEHGLAAHWRYKGIEAEEGMDTWLASIRTALEAGDNLEMMTQFKRDLYDKEIYVFTPNSDIIELPKGSCIVDFAYAIHSEVGNKMIGATVNDKIEPFDYVLSTGEICDIRTSKNSTGPKRSWLEIATASQTKSKIKSFFKKAERGENLVKGEILLKDEIKANNFDIDEVMTEENIEIALNKYKFTNLEEMYVAIGYGGISANKVFARLTEKIRKEKQAQAKLEKLVSGEEDNKKIVTETGVYVKGVDNILVRLSKCCQPIPGDEIVGFITKGRGVTVHRSSCPNLSEEDKERLLDVEWVESLNARRYSVTLQLHAFDRDLLLQNVLLTLSESRVEIKKLNSESKSDKTCVITISIYVKNVSECDFMIKKLRQIQDVYSVERIIK